METHSRAELRLCWPTYCKTRYIWKVCSKYDIFGQQRHVPGPGYRCKHYANNLSWCHTNPPPPPPHHQCIQHPRFNQFQNDTACPFSGPETITITITSTRRVGEMENKNKEPILRSECLCSCGGMCAL